jgi:hypothetical protein
MTAYTGLVMFSPPSDVGQLATTAPVKLPSIIGFNPVPQIPGNGQVGLTPAYDITTGQLYPRY